MKKQIVFLLFIVYLMLITVPNCSTFVLNVGGKLWSIVYLYFSLLPPVSVLNLY